MDELQKNYDEIKTYDTVILAISIKPPETNKEVKDKLGLEYPMLCDVRQQVVRDYGILDTKGNVRPSTFIINKKGAVTWQYIGQNDKDVVHNEIIIEKLREIDGVN